MSLVELLSWIVVAYAGAIGHEIAHYVVWTISGRDPRFHFWELCVSPTAGPAHTTFGDRLSAFAPYAIGSGCELWALVSSSVLWGIFGVAMFQIPSLADINTIRGRVRWATRVE